MLTAVGARDMLQWVVNATAGHMGYTLKEYFYERQSSLGMCWLKPPVGGFVSHPSQCTSAPKGKHIRPGEFVLKCQWRAPWAQEGTRKIGWRMLIAASTSSTSRTTVPQSWLNQ